MGLAKKAFVIHFTFMRYEHSSGYVLGAATPKDLQPALSARFISKHVQVRYHFMLL